MGGEFFADHHRAAAHQHCTGGNDAADAVIERQAIVHAIVGAGIHEAGEPETPLHQPVMADMGGLRQAGGAGGVDVQRAVGDGHAAALRFGQASARQLFDGAVDADKIVAAVRPDLWPARHERKRAADFAAHLGGDDDMLGLNDIEAMGERCAAKIGVDQRNDGARFGDAEPDRHIFGPVRHD